MLNSFQGKHKEVWQKLNEDYNLDLKMKLKKHVNSYPVIKK